MLKVVDWLFDQVLVKEFLSVFLVWRVLANKVWKVHFENPVDV